MKITESIDNFTQAYFSYYNVNLNFTFVPGELFNPIVKSYRTGELTLKDACMLLNQKLNK